MMTLIGRGRSERGLFGVTYHETAHMWFPMIVGPDEKAHRWMEEGLTSFNDNEGSRAFYSDESVWDPERQPYYGIAGTGDEVEPERHTDQFPFATNALGIAGYNKPSVALNALRGLFGEELFTEAYQEFAHRWMYKHPTPFDLFNTFEDVIGQDLDWFWIPMFYETWTLDQEIADVSKAGESILVHIRDNALTPMPSPVTVSYEDGRTETKTVPVDVWLAGERETELIFSPGNAVKVEIDAGKFLPDVNRDNNIWPREEE
jgi:aminopeptidase N